MTDPKPITTVEQAAAEAERALFHVKPGSAVVLTPHVLRLLLGAIKEKANG